LTRPDVFVALPPQFIWLPGPFLDLRRVFDFGMEPRVRCYGFGLEVHFYGLPLVPDKSRGRERSKMMTDAGAQDRRQ
jgi:hypothetical protein